MCEALAKNAYRQVKAMRDQLKPGKKVPSHPSENPLHNLLHCILYYNSDGVLSNLHHSPLECQGYCSRSERGCFLPSGTAMASVSQASTRHLALDCDQLECAQLSEMDIIEKIEKLTDPDVPEGEWINKIDLLEKVPILPSQPPFPPT